MNRLNDEQLEAALAECASEAIRIPGSIQPHGVLLTLSEAGLIIQQISHNCASLLGQTMLAGVGVVEQVRQALLLADLDNAEPLLVSHSVRTMCAAIAQLLSVQIGALQTRDAQHQREHKTRLINELTAAMHLADSDVLEGLLNHPEQLQALTAADGVAVLIEDRLQLFGECPTVEQVRALYLWVREQCLESSEPLLTDHLQGLHGASAQPEH